MPWSNPSVERTTPPSLHCNGTCWRIGLADPVTDDVVWIGSSFRPEERSLAKKAIDRYLIETADDPTQNLIPILERCGQIPNGVRCPQLA